MRPDLVLIATSAGGPQALEQIMPKLDKNLGVPVIVVQHMLDGYTKSLAESLNRKSQINIKEAEENEQLQKLSDNLSNQQITFYTEKIQNTMLL